MHIHILYIYQIHIYILYIMYIQYIYKADKYLVDNEVIILYLCVKN